MDNDNIIKELSFKEKFFFFVSKTSSIKPVLSFLSSTHERSPQIVNEEYDKLYWKKFVDDEVHRKTKTLLDACMVSYVHNRKINDSEIINCIYDGKWCKGPKNQYMLYYYKKFSDLVKKHILDDDNVIELGCGIGKNLFFLRSQNLTNNLEGYDISENSITVAKKINDRFSANIEFGNIDLTKDFDSSLIKGKTVITAHSLEQLKHFTPKIIDNLIKAKPKQVLHFEPILDFYGFTLRDIICKIWIKHYDYLNNLLSILKKHQKQNSVKITDAYRLGIGMNPFNETSFIRWIPNSTIK